MEFHFEAAETITSLKLDLIYADLDLALTLSQIARQTTDRDKSVRNRHNARRAYDALLKYMGSADLPRWDQEKITRRLAALKAILLKLGESF